MITAIIISTIAGATIGYTIAAMLMIGKRSEPKAPPKEPKKEQTRLFTVGSLVRWRGENCELLLMYEGDDRQTYTNILDTKDIIITDVPIEELEAVEE